MPLGGENVGTAYVRILMDGSGLSQSLRDELAEAEPAIGQEGETASKAWQKGFSKGFKKDNDAMLDDVEKAFAQGAGRFDRIGDMFADGFADSFRDTIRERFGGNDNTLADTISTNLLGDLQRTGNYRALLRDLRNIPVQVDKATRQIMLAEAAETKARNDQSEAIKNLRAQYKDLVFDMRRVEEGTTRLAHGTRSRLLDGLRDLREEMRRLGLETHQTDVELRDHEHRLRSTHPALRRSIVLTDGVARSIGSIFGARARNNFFNIFGRMTGAFAGLFSLPLKGLEKMVGGFASLSRLFTEAGGGFAGFLTVGGKIVTTLASIGVGAAGLAVILGGVITFVGLLTSGLLALAGAAVALAGSLTFALGGAITVIAGALVPLVAAVGVSVLAFKNMDKEAQKAFKNVGKAFKDMGKEASKNIFDSPKKDAKALEEAIKGLEKITGPVSKALGGLLDEFIASLKSPLIRNFQNFLGRVLPGMVTSLGHIFGNLGEAFIGVFRAIAPFVQQFLNTLGQVTQDFADFANSPEGKHKIRDFLRDARVSAQLVGDALGQIIGLMGDLLGLGQPTGNSLFVSLANTIQSWRDKLNAAKQDGVIQSWFNDAKNLTTEIGRSIEKVGGLIDKLDSPESRDRLDKLIEGFDDLVAAIEWVSPIAVAFFDTFVGLISPLVKGLGLVVDAVKALGPAFRYVYNGFIGPVFSIIAKAIGGLLEKLGDMFSILDSLPGAPAWVGDTAAALHHAADETKQWGEEIKRLPDPHITAVASTTAAEYALGLLTRPRTVTIHANLTGYPGPTTGGQNPTNPRQPTTSGDTNVTGGGAGKTVYANGWQIITPTSDSKAVANELLNRLVATGY